MPMMSSSTAATLNTPNFLTDPPDDMVTDAEWASHFTALDTQLIAPLTPPQNSSASEPECHENIQSNLGNVVDMPSSPNGSNGSHANQSNARQQQPERNDSLGRGRAAKRSRASTSANSGVTRASLQELKNQFAVSAKLHGRSLKSIAAMSRNNTALLARLDGQRAADMDQLKGLVQNVKQAADWALQLHHLNQELTVYKNECVAKHQACVGVMFQLQEREGELSLLKEQYAFLQKQSAARDADAKDLLLRSQTELTEVTEQLMARQAECKELRAKLLEAQSHHSSQGGDNNESNRHSGTGDDMTGPDMESSQGSTSTRQADSAPCTPRSSSAAAAHFSDQSAIVRELRKEITAAQAEGGKQRDVAKDMDKIIQKSAKLSARFLKQWKEEHSKVLREKDTQLALSLQRCRRLESSLQDLQEAVAEARRQGYPIPAVATVALGALANQQNQQLNSPVDKPNPYKRTGSLMVGRPATPSEELSPVLATRIATSSRNFPLGDNPAAAVLRRSFTIAAQAKGPDSTSSQGDMMNGTLEDAVLEVASATAAQAVQDTHVLEAQLSATQADLSAMQLQLSAAQSELADAQKELADVQAELSTTKANLQEESQARQAEREQSAAQLASLQQQLETAQQQLASLQASGLPAVSTKSAGQQHVTKTASDSAQAGSTQSKQDVPALQQEISSLQASVIDRDQQTAKVASDAAAMQKQLQDQIAELQGQLTDRNKHASQFETKVKGLQKSEQEVNALRQQLSQLQQQLAEKEQLVKTMTSKESELQQRIQKVEQDAKQELQAKGQKIEHLSSDLDTEREMHEAVLQELQQAKQRLGEVAKKQGELSREVANLQELRATSALDLADAHQRAARAEEDLQATQDALDDARSQMQSLEQELVDTQAALAALEMEASQLKTQLAKSHALTASQRAHNRSTGPSTPTKGGAANSMFSLSSLEAAQDRSTSATSSTVPQHSSAAHHVASADSSVAPASSTQQASTEGHVQLKQELLLAESRVKAVEDELRAVQQRLSTFLEAGRAALQESEQAQGVPLADQPAFLALMGLLRDTEVMFTEQTTEDFCPSRARQLQGQLEQLLVGMATKDLNIPGGLLPEIRAAAQLTGLPTTVPGHVAPGHVAPEHHHLPPFSRSLSGSRNGSRSSLDRPPLAHVHRPSSLQTHYRTASREHAEHLYASSPAQGSHGTPANTPQQPPLPVEVPDAYDHYQDHSQVPTGHVDYHQWAPTDTAPAGQAAGLPGVSSMMSGVLVHASGNEDDLLGDLDSSAWELPEFEPPPDLS